MLRKNSFFLTIVLFVAIGLSSCSTWHYKNPRVAVDVDPSLIEKESIPHSHKLMVSRTMDATSLRNETEEDELQASAEATGLIDNGGFVNPVVKNSNVLKWNQQKKYAHLSQQKRLHHLLKVKEVEKQALSGWLRIMIILFAVGLVLLIIGAIFSAVLGGGLWWLFYLAGSLCILAGAIVLLLGLLGVM